MMNAAPWTPNWSHHIPPEDRIEIVEPLLYDLLADPAEQLDVADEHPEIVADHRRRLAEIRTQRERRAGALGGGRVVELGEDEARQLEALGYGLAPPDA